MKFNRLLIASIFILAIFAIGAVSAADEITDTTDDVLAVDSVDEIELTYDDSAELSGLADDSSDEILKNNETYYPGENYTIILSTHFSGTTMTELSTFLRNAYDGDVIYLENDIEQDSSNYITINKQLTINGNGHSIDLNAMSYAFRVHNANATLMNMIIKNGQSENGGAIYSTSAGYCTLINCTFINNMASNHGGAVYLYSAGDSYISDCTFINNTAVRYGGAVFSNNPVHIDNCSFSYNNGECGAAVYCANGDSSIDDSDFTGNSGRQGAGAYLQGANMNNCDFNDNTADDATGDGARGGALYLNGVSALNNCSFTNNRAKTNKGYGGAIYIKQNCDMENCIFTNNAAGTSGGAVYAYTGASCNLTGCYFTGNAVNVADNAYGGAFFADGQSIFSFCAFAENTAINTGGAIYSAHDGCILTDCEFTGNTAGIAGAVYSTNGACDLTNCNFAENTAESCGAFYGDGTVENCTFTDNHATVNDGGAVLSTQNIGLINCVFYDNSANRDGGAVFTRQPSVLTGCIFNNNTAGRYGGAVTKADASDCRFINSAAKNGGAIHQGDASDSYFVNCTTTASGSAIYQGNAYDSVFINCYNSKGIISNGTSENCIFAESPALYCPDVTVNYGETAIVPVRIIDKDGNDVNGLTVNAELYKGDVLIDTFTAQSGSNLTLALDKGSYTLALTSEYVAPYNANIAVKKQSPGLAVEADPITAGETATITATLAEDATGSIIISLNGQDYTAEIVSGSASISVSGLATGDYEVTASYSGDETYDAESASTTLTVAKPSPGISAPAVTTKYGKDVNLTVYIANDATGNVNIKINGVTNKAKITNGVATYTVSGLNYGLYDVEVKYNGNYKYSAETISTTVKVNKNSPITSVSAKSIVHGEDATVTVKVAQNVPGNVKVTVNGVTQKAQIKNGVATATFSGLKAGTYEVSAAYAGNVNYVAQTKTATLTVSKGTPIISVNAPDAVFGTDATITVNLESDVPGNVRVTVNGVTEKAQIKNGVATYKASGLKAGTYEVSVSYAGNVNYNAQTVTASLTVAKANPITSVSVENINVGDTACVVVKTAANVNGNVKITVNGVTEKVKIVNGIATLNVTGLKAGTYDVSASYAGNANFKAQTKTTSLTVSKSSPGLSFTAVTKNGKTTVTANIAKDAPGNVKIIVDGVTVNSAKITDGVATYVISGLASGSHTIKVTYGGNYKYTAQSRTKTITI